MKSMPLPLAAIFFMTNFYRTKGGGGMAPSAPPSMDPLLRDGPFHLLSMFIYRNTPSYVKLLVSCAAGITIRNWKSNVQTLSPFSHHHIIISFGIRWPRLQNVLNANEFSAVECIRKHCFGFYIIHQHN